MNGLISFCDILGYQSFLANNSATESALNVLEIITNTPNLIRSEYSDSWLANGDDTKYNKEVADQLQHLVFSDTIVLMLPYPENSNEEWRQVAIAYITFFTGLLQIKMFSDGLPLRSVIHEGDFISKEACLAGKAIVEAYNIVESLDLSALVFSPELAEIIEKAQQQIKPTFAAHQYDSFFIPYLTPLKTEEKKLLHYNWLACAKADQLQLCTQDPDSFVLKSFWSHNKDCPISVDKKTQATSKLVRKLAIKYNELTIRILSLLPFRNSRFHRRSLMAGG